MEKIVLDIHGMTCTNCAFTIQRAVQEEPGVENVFVNFPAHEATLDLNPQKNSVKNIIRKIERIGYEAKSVEDRIKEKTGLSYIEKKFFTALAFTLPLFVLSMLSMADIVHLPRQSYIELFLCLPVIYIGITYFGKSAWASLRVLSPNMDVLISIGSSSAFIYSLIVTFSPEIISHGEHGLYYETAAVIITLVLLGNVMEQRSVKKTTSAIRELSSIQPEKANLIIQSITGGEEISEIEYSQIRTGDNLLVRNGEKIPADGKITWGSAQIDESMITGESVPAEKTVNDFVIGGTLNMQGTIKMQVTAVGSQSVLQHIIQLVKNAQANRPPIQKLADRISEIFVPVVVVIALLTFIISHFTFHISTAHALLNSIAVLVIACPCAMGLATPTAVMVGIGRGAKNGILIKGGDVLERLTKIQTLVFDKTGTLTEGKFKIEKLQIRDSRYDEKKILSIVMGLEKYSEHPIARSVVEELKHKEIIPAAVENLETLPSAGIRGRIKEKSFTIGSKKIVNNNSSPLENEIYSTLFLLEGEKLIAEIYTADKIKEQAKETIAQLKKENIETILLSGDKKSVSEHTAKELNIEKYFAEVLPENKLKIVSELQQTKKVGMMGDGINDAPALSKADVGISVSNGTRVAIESADVILLKGNLERLLTAIKLSRATVTTIRQNLFWAFFYNVIAIPVAAAGFLNPMIGAFVMAFSDVIVIGNSLRLYTKKL